MSGHLVEQGECLASLCEKFGFPDWHTIYDHAANSAFRASRPNPNVLAPGDVVEIPARQLKTAQLGTDSPHQVQVKQPLARLKIKLQDDQGTAFTNKKFRLTVGSTVIEDVTDGDGMVDKPIPPGNTSGELVFWPEGHDTEWEGYRVPLQLGDLRPHDTTLGAKQRLLNLGFFPGSMDEAMNPATQISLENFKRQHAMTPVDATLDDATKTKLRQVHEGA